MVLLFRSTRIKVGIVVLPYFYLIFKFNLIKLCWRHLLIK